jgi:hypothetical protein
VTVIPPDQPWETNYQRQGNDALERAYGVSDDQWRALRPPLPQIQYLPPRFGYPSYDQRQWNVMQVFGMTRDPVGRIPAMPSTRPQDRVDYTQYQGDQEGSDRNVNYDPLGLGGVSW